MVCLVLFFARVERLGYVILKDGVKWIDPGTLGLLLAKHQGQDCSCNTLLLNEWAVVAWPLW